MATINYTNDDIRKALKYFADLSMRHGSLTKLMYATDDIRHHSKNKRAADSEKVVEDFVAEHGPVAYAEFVHALTVLDAFRGDDDHVTVMLKTHALLTSDVIEPVKSQTHFIRPVPESFNWM